MDLQQAGVQCKSEPHLSVIQKSAEGIPLGQRPGYFHLRAIMAGSVRYLNRQLLQNVLHHVDTHNRLMEEREMWNMKKKSKRASSSDSEDGGWRGSNPRRGRNYGKMRSDNFRQSSGTNRNIFKRKLDEGKWTHNGFMELYPDEFLNKESMDEMSSDEDKKQKKKKRKKQKRDHEKSLERSGRTTNDRSGKTANHSTAKLANHRDERRASHAYSSNHKTSKTADFNSTGRTSDMREKRKQKYGEERIRSGKKMKDSEETSEESSTTSDDWNELEATVFDLKNSPKKKKKVRSDGSPPRLKEKQRKRHERREKHRKHEKRRDRSKYHVKR